MAGAGWRGMAWIIVALAGWLLAGQAFAGDVDRTHDARRLCVGVHAIQAEVAVTDAERQLGLMHRAELGPDSGMLFDFTTPRIACLWMKDTFIALSAAFLDAEGRIVAIADMQPGTLDTHCSPSPVRYALEMNQGWFAGRRIAPGARVEGLASP